MQHRHGFVRTYLFSLDHKVIGIQYAVTGLVFLLVGFILMMIMRYQMACPLTPVPFIGRLLSEQNAANGVLLPEFYNQLGAMHGTVMIFLGVVPLAVGGFGNYLVPLQIGASDMAFPKLNMASYWVYQQRLGQRATSLGPRSSGSRCSRKPLTAPISTFTNPASARPASACTNGPLELAVFTNVIFCVGKRLSSAA